MDAEIVALVGLFQSLVDREDVRVELVSIWLESEDSPSVDGLREMVARVPAELSGFPLSS
jgi:hypothetical protein